MLPARTVDWRPATKLVPPLMLAPSSRAKAEGRRIVFRALGWSRTSIHQIYLRAPMSSRRRRGGWSRGNGGPRLAFGRMCARCAHRSDGRIVPEDAESPEDDRVGSSPALPATYHRGMVWKPVLGFPSRTMEGLPRDQALPRRSRRVTELISDPVQLSDSATMISSGNLGAVASSKRPMSTSQALRRPRTSAALAASKVNQ
jgi:hypothetical protein